MEKKMGVWLDSEKAFLISLTDEGESVSRITSDIEHKVRFPGEKKAFHRLGGMLSNTENSQAERRKHQLAEYFHKVIENIQEADKVFLFGPSLTKEWLEKEINKNTNMAQKLCGIANSDLISENQMIAKVKDFFHEEEKKKRTMRHRRH